MSLTKGQLIEQFDKAREENAPFVFVGIEAEGVQETICIPQRSFDEKQAFYERSYTDDLVHVMNKNVFIRGLARGDSKQLDIIG
ncbi:hypothetical protein CWR48_15680 [Oceanobacillus arenosus]|uniref:Uncharacterized protein n=1 Tax=Oceanobacillus arenosus TaxID=1229153 RepID=A0A3D8PLS7_9BACI|nr:hypothetical protein [Oceanobacillus arenosus]RDW17040.1 hypothetical protein CWR48_15680 [Oceanobacillus arenosus]